MPACNTLVIIKHVTIIHNNKEKRRLERKKSLHGICTLLIYLVAEENVILFNTYGQDIPRVAIKWMTPWPGIY